MLVLDLPQLESENNLDILVYMLNKSFSQSRQYEFLSTCHLSLLQAHCPVHHSWSMHQRKFLYANQHWKVYFCFFLVSRPICKEIEQGLVLQLLSLLSGAAHSLLPVALLCLMFAISSRLTDFLFAIQARLHRYAIHVLAYSQCCIPEYHLREQSHTLNN